MAAFLFKVILGDKNLKQSKRLKGKIFVCLLGIVVLCIILSTYLIKTTYKHPKGEYISCDIVKNEIRVLGEVNKDNVSILALSQDDTLFNGEYLQLKDVLKMEEAFQVKSERMNQNYYQKDSYILTSDWNPYLELLIASFGKNQIITEELDLIEKGEHVIYEEKSLESNRIVTNKEIYQYQLDSIKEDVGNKVRALTYGNEIVAILDLIEDKIELKNTYAIEEKEGSIVYFWNSYQITTKEDKEYQCRDVITDLTINHSGIVGVRKKEEKTSGKILRVTDEEIEIENSGRYQLDENMQIYQLYGTLSTKRKEDLRIGYQFADFILDEGKIVAGLIMKDENMDTIRVLVKNSNLENKLHEKVNITCDSEYTVEYYQDGILKDGHTKKADDETEIDANTMTSNNERIKIIPKTLSANIYLKNVVRSCGIPPYRGTIEIKRQEEGFIVINEVLLEEYLYKVVPSEMPASYPEEALKAQAICARTYAYNKMMHAGLAEYGAHVDDSAAFQVYNNIQTQVSTTQAVKDTIGEVLWYGDTLVGAYYYSTSCGVGTDTGVWHGSDTTATPYLCAKLIGEDENKERAEKLQNEEEFREFITSEDQKAYEKEEGWYRWRYQVDQIEEEVLLENLKTRYDRNADLILTKNKDGEFESLPIKSLGKIKEIEISKRNKGGVAHELLITGTKATIKVITEMNIRSVLINREAKVERKSGDEVAALSSLPSGYFVIDTRKDNQYVIGYNIIGGGFGHGVGMSQNAAKDMSNEGMDHYDILSFFYENSEVKNMKP